MSTRRRKGAPPPGSIAGLKALDESTVVFRVSEQADPRALLSPEGVRARSTRGGLDGVLALAESSPDVRVRVLFPDAGAEAVRGRNVELAAHDARSARAALSGIHVLSGASPPACRDALEQLRGDPRVEYAHFPAIQYPLGAPNDPRLGDQWYLQAAGFLSAWPSLDPDDAPPVEIAVADNGVDTGHRDLPALLENRTYDDAPPELGHGTQICGVLAATRNNGIGIAGAARAAIRMHRIFPVRRAESAYAALRAIAEGPARILNYSQGSNVRDETIVRLVRLCHERGISVVAAMGNDRLYGYPRNQPLWPASVPEVIAVGATDGRGRVWRHSQTGDHIWMCAPGVDIWTCDVGDGYAKVAGTSFATALVTAAVALLRRAEPSLAPSEVKERMSKATAGHPPWNREVGHGVLDAAALAPKRVA